MIAMYQLYESDMARFMNSTMPDSQWRCFYASGGLDPETDQAVTDPAGCSLNETTYFTLDSGQGGSSGSDDSASGGNTGNADIPSGDLGLST